MTGMLLAHQGGWDEILMVLAPIALFGGLLAIANRRASTIASQREKDAGGHDGSGDAPGRSRSPWDEPTER
jgi:hypothetical protein